GYVTLGAVDHPDQSQDGALLRFGLAITFKDGLIEIAIRGRGRLLGAALPGGAGALALGLHGAFETFNVEIDSGVAAGIHDEVEGEPEGVIELEGMITAIAYTALDIVFALRQLRRGNPKLRQRIAGGDNALRISGLAAQLFEIGIEPGE